MRRYAGLALMAILVVVPFGVSSPIDGSFSKKFDIDAEPLKATHTFLGGERACVLACAERDGSEIISHLHIKVFDADNNLVAEDNGAKSLAGDFAGVAWYPPRTSSYRIEIYNVERQRNKVYIAIK